MAYPKKFALEEQMTYHARTWFEINGYAVKTEYRTPWGICDLVAVKFDSDYCRTRDDLGQSAVGNLQRVALLESIPAKARASADQLTQATVGLLAPEEVERELKYLTKHHFVKSFPEGFQRITPARVPRNLIIAVELKLNRLEEVVSQAVSNLTFAHESYVALPDQNAQRLGASSRAAQVAAWGVGILGVERGGCETLLKSRGNPEKVNPFVRAHCIERFWRTIRGRTS